MTDNVVILPVIRRMNHAASPAPVVEQQITQHRKIAVDLDLTPEKWKRMERKAWERCGDISDVIASMVSEQLDGEGEV